MFCFVSWFICLLSIPLKCKVPFVGFEIQTFNYPLSHNQKNLANLICYLHDIILDIKLENSKTEIDQKLIKHLLWERYMVYEYYELHSKTGYQPLPQINN